MMLAMSAVAPVLAGVLAIRLLATSFLDPVVLWVAVIGQGLLLRGLIVGLGVDTIQPDYLWAFGSESEIVRANLLLTVWIGCAAVGVMLVRGMRLSGRVLLGVPRRIPPNILMAQALVFLVGTLLVAGFLLARSGSIGASIVAAKSEKSLSGLFFVRALPEAGSVVGLACYLSGNSWRSRKRVVGLLLITLAGATLFLYGARGPLIFSVMVVLLGPRLLRISKQRFSLSGLLRAGGLALLLSVVALTGLLQLREVRNDILGGGNIRGVGFARELSIEANLVVYDSFVLAVRDFPKSYDFRDGEDLKTAVAAPVPRLLWPGKPQTVVLGSWFRQLYEPEKLNGWPIGPMGEWYINLGFTGIVLGGIVTGVVLGGAQRAASSITQPAWRVAVTVTFALRVLGPGVSVGTIPRWLTWLVPISIVYWLYRGATKSNGRGLAQHDSSVTISRVPNRIGRIPGMRRHPLEPAGALRGSRPKASGF